MRPCGRKLLGLEQYHQACRPQPSPRRRRTGRARCAWCARAATVGTAAANGPRLATSAWRQAARWQLRGTLTHISRSHGRAYVVVLSRIMSEVAVPLCGALVTTRLGRIPGQHCRRTSKFECCELSVVVIRRTLIHETLGCAGAGRWGSGRDRPFRHSYTNVYTPCRVRMLSTHHPIIAIGRLCV